MDEMHNGRHELAGKEAVERAPDASLDHKAVREAKGLSLDDIFRQTRVSLINLTAVENQDFPQLPPPVYARDYIRKYARAIGIDESPLLARYEKYRESLNPQPEETEVRKPWPEKGRPYRFLFATLGALTVMGLMVYAFYLSDRAKTPLLPGTQEQGLEKPTETFNVVEEPPVTAIESPKPATEPAATIFEAREPEGSPVKAPVWTPPAPSSPAKTGPAERGEILHLVIEAHELTWVRITQDGSAQQVLLQPGERIERSAKESFLLDVGNAGGIRITYQGKALPSLGKAGEVVHIQLPVKPQGP